MSKRTQTTISEQCETTPLRDIFIISFGTGFSRSHDNNSLFQSKFASYSNSFDPLRIILAVEKHAIVVQGDGFDPLALVLLWR